PTGRGSADHGRDPASHLEQPRKVAKRDRFHPQSRQQPWRTAVERLKLPPVSARRGCLMKSILACVTAFLLAAVIDDRYIGARAAADAVPATLTGPALLDDWGNRFTSLGASVPENPLRTQVRTTIAQLAMFDAVNAVLDGPYRPFASKPASAPGASPEAAAIRAAYIVALNEFPTKTATINSAYNTSIAR